MHLRHVALHRHILRTKAEDAPQDSVPQDVQVPQSPLPSVSQSDGPTVVKRSSSTTCGGGDCEHYNTSKATAALPIALGVVIPVTIAIVILVYLHRRHIVRLRREDNDDKHRSLDFGMGDVETPASRKKKSKKGNRKSIDMEEKPRQPRLDKGISLDMSDPYLLPPGVHGARDSIQALSKQSASAENDTYRPAATSSTAASSPVHSTYGHAAAPIPQLPPIISHDDDSDMHRDILRSSQRVSHSTFPLHQPADRDSRNPFMSEQEQEEFELNLPTATSPGLLSTGEAVGGEDKRNSQGSCSDNSVVTDIRKSNGYLSHFVHPEGRSPFDEAEEIEDEEDGTEHGGSQENRHHSNVEVVVSDHSNSSNFPLPTASSQHEPAPTQAPSESSAQQPPRISLPPNDENSETEEEEEVKKRASSGMMVPPPLNANDADETDDNKAAHQEAPGHPSMPPRESTYDSNAPRNTQRFTFGLRPLPPEDPSEDPEQRASRIRSFYKEYFDPSRPVTGEFNGNIHREDPHGPDFYGDVFDPVSGLPSTYGVPRPFAEPVGRRAMTPPPRSPPMFQGRISADSGFDLPSPRILSSASNRIPPPPTPKQRKPAPPPAPLKALPTPHMLKDDFYMDSIDFAPGKNFKDQREGRPDTPTGGLRSFSPMTPAHHVLASPFEELGVVPSPHALRISGTFSSLDFMPPPRFKNSETGSDAGSVRSNGSGISAVHMNNIRNGAYRVSRLPKDTVGTKDDMYAQLRPRWDMTR